MGCFRVKKPCCCGDLARCSRAIAAFGIGMAAVSLFSNVSRLNGSGIVGCLLGFVARLAV